MVAAGAACPIVAYAGMLGNASAAATKEAVNQADSLYRLFMDCL
jgi:hypothetical protein